MYVRVVMRTRTARIRNILPIRIWTRIRIRKYLTSRIQILIQSYLTSMIRIWIQNYH